MTPPPKFPRPGSPRSRPRGPKDRAGLKKRAAMLLIVGGLLHLSVLIVDRLYAAPLADAGLRDPFYFGGVAISMLLMTVAGFLIWRSIRAGS